MLYEFRAELTDNSTMCRVYDDCNRERWNSRLPEELTKAVVAGTTSEDEALVEVLRTHPVYGEFL